MTVIGPDRTGLVDSIAGCVADHGGNWLESRMCRLGGQFAGLVQLKIEASQTDQLVEAISALATGELQITIHGDSAIDTPVPGILSVVDLVGQDRPGLLHEITAVFAKHGLNVEELSTELTDAPQGGGTLFKATVTVLIPESVGLQVIGDDLERLANDLMVDIAVLPTTAG